MAGLTEGLLGWEGQGREPGGPGVASMHQAANTAICFWGSGISWVSRSIPLMGRWLPPS